MLSFDQIIKALKAGEDVKAIELSGNRIRAEGAKALAHALEKNNTVTTMYLRDNQIGDELLNDIRDKLEKNKLQAEALQSKEIEQGVDSVQEKLLVTNIGSEKKQEISKKMQQIKKIAQEQKLNQQEEIHDVLLAKINKCKNDALKAKSDKEIQQLVKELKYDVMLLKLQKMQQLKVAIGEMKPLEGDNYKWLLANISNAGNFYEVTEKLLTGDIAHPPEDV